MADVFIDYEPSDGRAAKEVERELVFRGLSAFVVERLAPAERTPERLAVEAGRAKVIVLLWSATAATALSSRGALERTASFIRYWSEDRLVLARLDKTELPLGLKGVATIPLRVDLWEKIAQAAFEIHKASLGPVMMDLGDHEWGGVTQVWVAQPDVPRPRSAGAEPQDLGDHDWQGATQLGAASPAPAPVKPVEARPDSLFVSYAHNDLPRVDPVVAEISALGFPVWLDREQMAGAAGWAGQITRAIKSSRAIVLMASSSAYASDHVVREMYLAMNAKKKIVPLELEQAAMPDEFEYILAPFQRYPIGTNERAAVLSRAFKTL